MRPFKLLCAIFSLVALSGCGGAPQSDSPAAKSLSVSQPAAPAPNEAAKSQAGSGAAGYMRASLQQADQAQAISEAMNRKIIKDAEVTLEVDSPIETQGKVTSIAEARGGFVVTSESKQRPAEDPSQRVVDVSLVIRVPASQFGPTRDEILGLSKNILDKKTTGQDVTEEFIDLEARIKTQVALEAQFMEIMKQAHKVEDALEVQRQIAEVRTEIEKLEGRKRFLENRSSLSTITVNLKAPTTIVVNATGFGRDVKEATKESVEIARDIVLFLIRFVIVMIPIFLFIFLPLGLVLRYLIRRAHRVKLTGAVRVEPTAPVQPA
jgi:hypothetical protein